MFIEMDCSCEASVIFDDAENADSVWLLVHRFANAHEVCGFMTAVATDAKETTKRKVVRSTVREDDDE